MRKEQETKWRAPQRREEEFKKEISILIDEEKRKEAEKVMKVITTTCGKVITSKKTGVYWWSKEVPEARRECIKKRRKMQRINAEKEGKDGSRVQQSHGNI